MANGLPSVVTTLASNAAPPSVADTANLPLVVGPCSTGPNGGALNVPTTLAGPQDLPQYGNGPGIEMAAEVGQAAGWPVTFVRSETTTPSVMSDLYKVEGSGAGAAKVVYGTIILPGADANGSVMLQSLQPGVTLTVVQGGAAAFTASGLDVTLTVVAATTTAANIVALSLAAVADLIGTPTLPGSSNTGASVCASTLSKTAFDNGLVSYVAKVGSAVQVPGADANGGLVYLSNLTGVKVVQVISGNNTALDCYVDPATPNIITLVGATDSGGTGTTTAAQAVTKIKATPAAMALLNGGAGVAYTGTGAGLISAATAKTLVRPRVRQVAPAQNSQSLAVTVADNTADVSVALATDASGRDTSTATLVKNAVNGGASGLFVTASGGGTGGGVAGPAAYQTLLWGGDSALTIAGTPVDRFYAFGVRVSQPGALGASPAPQVQWTVDGINWSSQVVVPGTGEVAFTDPLLASGLTGTFTGTMAAGEIWWGASTEPQSGSSDLQAAVAAAIADTTRAWGFASSPCAVDRATLTALDSQTQAALQTRFLAGIWGSRDVGAGVPGETEAQWVAAVITDLQGFTSPKGLSSYGAEPVLVTSPYTRRQYWRAGSYAAAARKASIPIHENLGKRKTGTLHNVLAIRHDESKVPGFATQRIRSTMTYPSKPGSYYFWGAPTMADPVADPGYVFSEYVAVALSAARAAHDTAENELNDSLPAVNAPEAGNVPVGALTLQAASDIQAKVESAVAGLIMRAKSDGKASASGPGLSPQGVPLTAFTQVLRTNNYLQDHTIYINVNLLPLGLTQTIRDTITVQIPG